MLPQIWENHFSQDSIFCFLQYFYCYNIFYLHHIPIKKPFKIGCHLIVHSHTFLVKAINSSMQDTCMPPIRECQCSDPCYWLYCWSEFSLLKGLPVCQQTVHSIDSIVNWGGHCLVFATCSSLHYSHPRQQHYTHY